MCVTVPDSGVSQFATPRMRLNSIDGNSCGLFRLDDVIMTMVALPSSVIEN